MRERGGRTRASTGGGRPRRRWKADRWTAVLAVAGLLAAAQAAAQAPEVPRFAEVAGHDFGERITLHADAVRYLERLDETSPRVRVEEQGASWEGRRLLLAIVTSPENHARLEEIREGAARLGDPRGLDRQAAERLVAEQPAVVWLGGSIHGNELSGAEGIVKLLEHLATRDDAATRRVLESTVVLIDPILNPDGRDAFAQANRRRAGAAPRPEREDWGNDWTGWEGIGFRTGHYVFDTNRDWFAHTQAETRARVPTLLAWRPQVAVDAHEMGADVEFYFDPADEPYGPRFPPYARRWFERFNEAYAAAFDSAGFEYMTRERYNYFYPGYTTSYTTYQGAVGMLYEQGTSNGLSIERPDGSVRTLAEALEHQYAAAWTAVQTAAERRGELLSEYLEAHREAVAGPGDGPARYYLLPSRDPGLARELADLLVRNGIEVGRLDGQHRAEGLRDRAGAAVGARTLTPGTYVVEAAQPRRDLVRVLLEPDVPLSESWLQVARQRVERDENARFYDITAWSLPLLFNLEAYAGSGPPPASVRPHASDDAAPAATSAPEGRAGYAYLLEGRHAAAMAALQDLLEAGHRAGVLLRPTRIGGRDVPSGTVVLKVGQNGEALHGAVREAAERHGVALEAVASGLAEPGHPSLGSADVIPVRPARVALAAEGPVHGYSFGWTWHVLEEQYGIPTTVLRVGSLGGPALADYDVLVLPHLFSAAGLARELGEEGIERLRTWVREGGVLVTVGGATTFAREHLDLSGLRSWYEEEEGEAAYRFTVPGALLRARLDLGHWLAAGYPEEELPVLVTSDRVLLGPEGPVSSRRRAVARLAPSGELRLSGHVWPESAERLGEAVFLYEERLGRGRVVAFAEDPSFRGYFRGADRLLLNAVVLGPSAP